MRASHGDVRALLGMHTRAAWALAAFFFCAEVALAVSTWRFMDSKGPVLVGLALTGAAIVALLRVRADPLPLRTAMAVAGSIPLGVTLTLLNMTLPAATPAQLWSVGAGTALATFLCVRGRTALAWLGMLSMIAVVALFAWHDGLGPRYGVGISIVNLGPLLMSTFFAYTLRPAAHDLYELRAASTRKAEAEAAAAAELDERLAQTARLDQLVRPLLDTLAGPDPIDPRLGTECLLAEAQLRDSLRAPALTTGTLLPAARHARERGVEVVLTDDHGLDGTDPAAAARIRATLTAELDAVRTGSVHIRILPPHRPTLVTLVHTDANHGTRRLDFDRTGRPQPTTPD